MTRIRMVGYLIVPCAVWYVFVGVSNSYGAFAELFASSDECAFCHISGANSLIDSRGNDLSIAGDWSSTMMANSFKDPLFRAKARL